MIGNDLIYLPGWSKPDPERQRRFRNKLFTESEQLLLNSLPEYGEALLWSMKESAYKLVFRSNPSPRFAPKSLVAHIESLGVGQISGVVSFESSGFNTLSHISNDFLHTIAVPSGYEHCLEKVGKHFSDRQRNQSDYRFEDPDGNEMIITKDEFGIPRFDNEPAIEDSYVSISHDASRIAIAWVRGCKGD